MMHKYAKVENIIWDWNGTLLDDMEVCIRSINVLLTARGLPLMDAVRYRQIFTFPIIEYYQAAGFDFSREPFEVPAEEFMVLYKRQLADAKLFPDVHMALEQFRSLGIRQYILSAMEQQALERSLEDHGITRYFDGMYGIADNYAVSKISRGLELIKDHKLIRNATMMVGDTLHDAEVARELGIEVLVVGRGHQHPHRIQTGQVALVGDLAEVISRVGVNNFS